MPDKENIMTTLLDTVHTLPLIEAKDCAIEYIENAMDTKKANIKRLIFDVKKARSSKEISGILWRSLLAKEGLRVTGSSWKKHYDDI